MKEGQRLWTRDELIIAINLYCKLPFGKIHSGNPGIITLAKLINRTPAAVVRKLGNFASFDPSLKARGIGGLPNASKLDGEIWQEFFNHWDTLPYESEKLRAQFEFSRVEELNHLSEYELPREGKVREQVIQARVNQAFFRQMILAAYDNTCCITGLKQSELLVAGHIRPWGLDEGNRMNPSNGISINALHDRAFESGYMTITPEYKIKIAPVLLKQKSEQLFDYFGKHEDQEIFLPKRFLPDVEFLKYHNQERFKH